MTKPLLIISLCIALIASPAFAEDFVYRLPDTGQTKCYDNEKEIPCPKPNEPFYGQDANYTINPMTFTKLEHGMVKDNNTGLIWEGKTDDGSIHDKDNEYTWQDAQDKFIRQLNQEKYGGYSDWRLPTREELRSIVHYGKYNPAIDENFFPNTGWSEYWSSSSYDDYDAWYVVFDIGHADVNDKSYSRYYVRAVRCGQSLIRSFDHLVINSDGTVTDKRTSLMWQQGETEKMAWKDALAFCENLKLAGYDDWRLPTIKELESLAHLEKYESALNKKYFPNIKSPGSYWSSTSRANDSSCARIVDLCCGSDVVGYKSGSNYVRAVRSGQAGSLDHLVISAPKPEPAAEPVKPQPLVVKPTEPPPKLWFTFPRENYETDLSYVQVEIKAENLPDTTDALTLLVNEKPLSAGKGKRVRPAVPGETVKTVESEVPLIIGYNRIEVRAADKDGKIYSFPPLTVIRKGQPLPALYYFGVGVSKHSDPASSLRYPAKDVTEFAKVLEEQKGRAWSDVKIKILADEKATQREVITEMNRFVGQAKADDLVILFLSGHGKNEQGDYYFVAHDTVQDNMIATGLSWITMINLLRKLPSKVLLLADTCYSGSVVGTDLISKTDNIMVLSSSSGDRVSREDASWGHGAFTLALIEGFRDKAFNRDGEMKLFDLNEYVKKRVLKLTEGSQEPRIPNWSNYSKFENVILGRKP